MRRRTFAFAVALVIASATLQFGQTRQQSSTSGYLLPPKVIVGKIDTPHYYLLREARLPERGVNILAGSATIRAFAISNK